MLVWRDLPNPSHTVFERDVKRYREAGIVGFYTESRMALATTGINFYLRGRLMWDPDSDVNASLDDYYAKFYGPAQRSMRDYWTAIFDAWRDTIVTEHEFFVAPAIYTPALVKKLGESLAEAEKALESLRAPGRKLSRNESLYLEHARFARLGYEVLKSYMAMVEAAATNVDYENAVAAGEEGLKARAALTEMNKAFTAGMIERGLSSWPGEVRYYREVLGLVNGEKGRLLLALPLDWAFHRDPEGEGDKTVLIQKPVDLGFWREHGKDFTLEARKDYPTDKWEVVRSDLYVQAQGVRAPDGVGYAGDLWYRTDATLTAEQAAAKPHLFFPGLFNACELFVNDGKPVRRSYKEPWWLTDYRFQWDVPLEGKLREGVNAFVLHCQNPHHMGGMFRRPFLYAPNAAQASVPAEPSTNKTQQQ